MADVAIYQRPAELLQHLIRFDTTNPPGNEAACIAYIDDLLRGAGIETTLLEKVPGRPNLIARLAGEGHAAPLLLYGHVDVVTTANQPWTRPPFGGDISDGVIWGRGTLDMKGGVAMMLAAFLRAKAENIPLPGDVILCIVSDEEVGGEMGAGFLVEQHRQLFEGVRYAIGEFGGFSTTIGGKRFYPIMVAEKQICWMRATVRGPAGHGSIPVRGGAMAKAGRFLTALDKKPLPVHITPPARLMFEAIAAQVSFPINLMMRQLLNPLLTDRVLNLMGDKGRPLSPLLRNTASPTIIRGGEKSNVIPAEVSIELDGRLLPGFGPDDMKRELRAIAGPDVEIELLRYDSGPSEPNMGLFAMLAGVLRAADPTGTPIPLLLSAVTDARFFSQLGIQTYGFLPMQIPDDLDFTRLIHAADERIPVDSMTFGTNAIYTALQRFTD